MSKTKETTIEGTIFHWGEGERPSLTQAVSELQDVGLLPKRESWWFAWREVEIELPRELSDINDLRTDWDVLHIFSRNAEFRQIRRGRRYEWLLLTEKERPGFGHSWVKSKQPYKAILSHRIMWGERLRKPASGNSGVDEARGVVEFPRPLAYDLAGERTGNNYDKALVADVCLYFDDEARLQTVRYMRIRHLPPGADEIRMKTFGEVMGEAFP